MAIIGKIRSRLGGLLVVMVGGALLLFVVSDLFDSRGGGMFSRRGRSVGTIAGESVDIQDFERQVSDEVDALRNNFGQNVDNQAEQQIRDAVWNEIMKRRVLKTQVEAAGFGELISKEEYDDIRFGNNMLPDFKNQPNFQDPRTGQADPEKVRQWFINVETNSPVYYAIQKRRLVESRLYTKYNTLVKKSTFANSAQAKDEFEEKNLKANFNFVVKPFANDPDSLYAVSDADLEQYYGKHKNEKKYHQKASRSFDFVVFPVAPTEEDKEHVRAELAELKEPFQSNTDDSLFVVGNAESRSYMKSPYQEGSTDALTDSLITHADTGAVVGALPGRRLMEAGEGEGARRRTGSARTAHPAEERRLRRRGEEKARGQPPDRDQKG
jgi:peptidyl-prolyl cis-trans isomerase D